MFREKLIVQRRMNHRAFRTSPRKHAYATKTVLSPPLFYQKTVEVFHFTPTSQLDHSKSSSYPTIPIPDFAFDIPIAEIIGPSPKIRVKLIFDKCLDIHGLISSGNLFYPFLKFLFLLRIYSANISNEFITKKRKWLFSGIHYLGFLLINN